MVRKKSKNDWRPELVNLIAGYSVRLPQPRGSCCNFRRDNRSRRAEPAGVELAQSDGVTLVAECQTPPVNSSPICYTNFTFLSGKLRTGLPVAAKIAFSTAGATTLMVGSPTPPQKS